MNFSATMRTFLFAISIIFLGTGLSLGQVSLRWSPSDTTQIAPGDSTRLSVHLDETIYFRTVEITVNYDTTIIQSLGGGPGALFNDSGYFVFEGFEETPGSLHGYAVIMGAKDFLTGPGEILFWDIEGSAEGICPIISVEALLFDEHSPPNIIPDVTLSDAAIIVHSPLSAASDIPGFSNQLRLTPNPFNPQTRISFDIPRETSAKLSVYDISGHLVTTLFDGLAPIGTLSRDWNGKDHQGRSQPNGVYLFQLKTPRKTARVKGILLK